MNTKSNILILCVLFALTTTTIKAQIRESIISQSDSSGVITEGNLSYLRKDKTFERVETKDLKGKSYEEVLFGISPEYNVIMDNLIRTVFTKERANQLSNLRILVTIYFSPVENKILHFSFYTNGTDNDNYPLKLSEFYDLEQRIRAEPKLIPPFSSSGKMVDHGERLVKRIVMNRLYE